MAGQLARLRPVFPTFSLDEPGKRCLNKSRRVFQPSQDRGLDLRLYEDSEYRYHAYGKYLTPNNLHDTSVLDTFLKAVRLISGRLHENNHGIRDHEIDVVIMIRCVSPTNPKWWYYIADHTDCRVKWLEGQIPEYPDTIDPQMRDNAEYWHHRSRLPSHRPCSREEGQETTQLLNEMSKPGNNHETSLSQTDITQYRDQLNEAISAPVLEDKETIVIARTHSELLKHSLPCFYKPSPSLKCKMIKSLSGFTPRFMHNPRRTHENANRNRAEIVHDHLMTLNPEASPHPSVHTPSPRDSARSDNSR